MKKALIGTAIASAVLLSTQSAQAENGYIGIDYQMYSFSATGTDDLEPESVVLKLGGNINQYVQLEGRFGRSVSDDNSDTTALKIDDIVGFYVKGGMEMMDMVFPYVIVGYSKVDFEFYDDIAQTESDISYGVGADVHFGQMQVGLEWMMMQDKTDYQLEVISLSGAWRF